MKKVLIAVSAALLATACATTEDGTVDTAALGPMATPTRAMPYMTMASSGDLFEIESSRLALQMSQNPAVRNFAQMLIDDHTRMSTEMMTAARGAGLTPPTPQLLPHHNEMLNRLRAASATDFDMMYRQEQLTAHQEALNLHRTYAEQGDRAALKAVASRAVAPIQMHLTHAQTLPSTPTPMPEPVVQQPQPTYTPPATTPPAGERG
jgi:putative membrane protein